MSVSYIPEKVKTRLWGKAAGRCQYDGCNEPLWYDSKTKVEFNLSYIAHIVADSPKGPRGDVIRSEELKNDINNLMLLCDGHHRLIDREDVEGHPENVLVKMKKNQEEKMELLTSLTEDKQTHVLFYGANIGQNSAPLNMKEATYALLPEKYPAEKNGIELSLLNSAFQDDEQSYWIIERENLRRQFEGKVRPRMQSDLSSLSVFALAPQPLLIELGMLLSDIQVAEVFQKHREPSDWRWQDDAQNIEFNVIPPDVHSQTVAINISLSATIDNSRIRDVLGNDTSIWTITIDTPYNDFLKSREQLKRFRETFRKTMDRIKDEHGHQNQLHLFPAAPVSIAIEIGRAWMPKADLPLIIYDENRKNGGFEYVLDIKHDAIKSL